MLSNLPLHLQMYLELPRMGSKASGHETFFTICNFCLALIEHKMCAREF